MCALSRDVSVELPFVLMHPKPSDLPMSRPQSGTDQCVFNRETYVLEKCFAGIFTCFEMSLLSLTVVPETDAPVGSNLIEFETK